MPFLAEVELFSGPLDLMLHLIRENKLDIFDLDMNILCDEYLAYIAKLENLELEIESEYLVELATLIEYKSKRLLPKNTDAIEDGYEEDPRDALVKRLLEYERYKQVSKTLLEGYEDRAMTMAKPISDLRPYTDDEIAPYDGNVSELFRAMGKVLRRLQLAKPVATKYAKKEVSIDDRLVAIRARLRYLDDEFAFSELIGEEDGLEEVVVTFLAVLELIKDSVLDFDITADDVIHLKRRH